MKYMTKEWYQMAQNTSFHLGLRASKEAEVCSEKYYKKLYKREEQAWLRIQEDVSKVKFEDIYPDGFRTEDFEYLSLNPDQLEAAKNEYDEMRENYRTYSENKSTFSPESEKKIFRQNLRQRIKNLKNNLPYEILERVADIRVLALDRASAKVKKEISLFCKSNNKTVEKTMNSYWKEFKKNFRTGEPDFVSKFDFHDCDIISCRTKGNDIVLSLDNSGGFTSISQIILKNCSIIKQDEHLNGAWWLYDEIYKINDGYEIHVLLSKKKLVDFVFTVTNIEYM